MSKLRVHCFSLSLDGFGAGPNQSLDAPLGEGGEQLHQWFFPTRTFQSMYGKDRGESGVEEDLAARGFENIGAWIMGRNMFTSSRGPWPDDGWKGWWGEVPPYHTDVFVLTHHAKAPIAMEGGTTFHFVTEGIEAALERAKASAKDKDVRLGGGVSAVRQYLKAGLVDEMHLPVSPVVLGGGENLLAGLDLDALGYARPEYIPGKRAAHFIFRKA